MTSPLILIPGWATDCRIFDSSDLKSERIIPLSFSPRTFEKKLLGALEEKNIARVSLFGWSLGGFLAAEFAAKHKRLIDRLTLVSIRKKYEKKEIEDIRQRLLENKVKCLQRFYTQCIPERDHMRWFRRNLLKSYCEGFETDYLFETLGYLEASEIRPESLAGIKGITIIHGEADSIAPIEEAIDIAKSLHDAEFIRVKDTGHAPFFKRKDKK